MNKKNEQRKKELMFETYKRLKILKDKGLSDDEIVSVIKKMELPLDVHLYIMENYSFIVEKGRPKTKQDIMLEKLR